MKPIFVNMRNKQTTTSLMSNSRRKNEWTFVRTISGSLRHWKVNDKRHSKWGQSRERKRGEKVVDFPPRRLPSLLISESLVLSAVNNESKWARQVRLRFLIKRQRKGKTTPPPTWRISFGCGGIVFSFLINLQEQKLLQTVDNVLRFRAERESPPAGASQEWNLIIYDKHFQ